MKPDWDKLGDAHAGSSSVTVGDVDCTSGDGESVCSEAGVQGYPTIKYFTAETGKEGTKYSGGRDFDSLDKFVKETLAKKCDVATKDDCDDQEKAYIDKMVAKGAAKISDEAKRLEGMKGQSMKPDKMAWLTKRISILKDLAEVKGKEEL